MSSSQQQQFDSTVAATNITNRMSKISSSIQSILRFIMMKEGNNNTNNNNNNHHHQRNEFLKAELSHTADEISSFRRDLFELIALYSESFLSSSSTTNKNEEKGKQNDDDENALENCFSSSFSSSPKQDSSEDKPCNNIISFSNVIVEVYHTLEDAQSTLSQILSALNSSSSSSSSSFQHQQQQNNDDNSTRTTTTKTATTRRQRSVSSSSGRNSSNFVSPPLKTLVNSNHNNPEKHGSGRLLSTSSVATSPMMRNVSLNNNNTMTSNPFQSSSFLDFQHVSNNNNNNRQQRQNEDTAELEHRNSNSNNRNTRQQQPHQDNHDSDDRISEDDDDNSNNNNNNNNNNNSSSSSSSSSSSIPPEWIVDLSSMKHLKWSSIIGADSAIESLEQAVVLPAKHPELFLIHHQHHNFSDEENDNDDAADHHSLSSSDEDDNDDHNNTNIDDSNKLLVDDVLADDNDDILSSSSNNSQKSNSSSPSQMMKQNKKNHNNNNVFFPWSALLLHGPVGTGKTALAHATAIEANASCLISVSAADLLSKWVGESEKAVRRLFQTATTIKTNNMMKKNKMKTHLPHQQPHHHKKETVIIFLDEIDALCSSRGSEGETEATRRIKTEFLVQLQKIKDLNSSCSSSRDTTSNHHNHHDQRNNNNNNNNVLVLAATNFPQALDSAFARRFDQFIYVGLPDAKSRFKILCRELSCFRSSKKQDVKVLSCFVVDNENEDIERSSSEKEEVKMILPSDATVTISDIREFSFSSRLDGYSGSDLKVLAKHALMNPIRRLQRQMMTTKTTKKAMKIRPASDSSPLAVMKPLPLSKEDLEAALLLYPRSSSDEQIKRHEMWNKEHR